MKLSLGIFQSEMRNETPLEKISRLETHLSKTGNLDLVVCPELFISGYGSSISINKYSETSDGEFAIKISNLAKKFSTAIIYGYPEIDNNQLFNSAQFFSNDGLSMAIIVKNFCRQPRKSRKFLHLVKRAQSSQ